jgi:hypothetical protein
LNISQYKLLCKTCDSILEKNKSIYRVAIPLLHVLKEHPFILKRYPFITGSKNIDSTHNTPPSFFSGLRNFFYSLLAYKTPDISFKNIGTSKVDVVFVSHLVNASHLNLKNDFYFSDIPRYLKSEGINSLVVLINHTEEQSKNLSEKITAPVVPTVVIPNRLSVFEEIDALFGLAKELVSIRNESNRESGLKKECLRFASNFRNSAGALFGLRVSNYVHRVLEHFKPAAVVTIYEGHAWERLVYHAAAQKNILRIGYQHSVVTQYSHAMCRSLGVDYDPDIIYTSGNITNRRLTERLSKSHTHIATLGSNTLVNIKPTMAVESKTKTCLVIPEGLYDECEILFKFTLQCANKLPYVNFIWRLHPQLAFDKVLDKIMITKEELPKNIVVSDLSLGEDINISTHVVYRGSTAVIEAIYGGLIPIYLSDGSNMTIDLLYDKNVGKKIVQNFDEFKWAINLPLKDEVGTLQKYCKEYFSQLDSAVLACKIKKHLANY